MLRTGRAALPILLLAAVPAVAAEPPAPPPPPPLVTYRMAESWKSLSPRGERVRALSGTVAVAGDRMRWEISHGRFPRSTASLSIAGRDGVELVDLEARSSGRSTAQALRGLFLPGAAGEPGLASTAVRELAAEVRRDGDGPAFEGRPTARYRLTLSYRIDVATPGRVTSVKTRSTGTLLAVDAGLPEPTTPAADLVRLVPARGEALEAIESELAKVRGLVVRARVESESERAGAVVGGAGTAEEPVPLKSTAVSTREVSGLSVRPFAPSDAALFGVPDDVRSVAWERLVLSEAGLP